MKCSNPNCNETDHEIGAKFCHVCGQRLPNESELESPKPANDSIADNTRSKKNRVLVLLAILVVVVGVAVLFWPHDYDASREYEGSKESKGFIEPYTENPSANVGVKGNGTSNSSNNFSEPIDVTPTAVGATDGGISQTYVSNNNTGVVVYNGTVITNNNNAATVTHAYDLDNDYSELCIENAFDVWISSDATQVLVTADESAMSEVVIEKKSNKLRLYFKGSNINLTQSVKVVLPYNLGNLTKVDLSGVSTFHSDYALDGTKVEINLSGTSGFYCDIKATEICVDMSGTSIMSSSVEADKLKIDMEGCSLAVLGGRVDLLKTSLSGSCKIVAKTAGNRGALNCNQCVGTMSAASSARIYCDGNISVDLGGTSNLVYSGSASTAGSSTSITSSIIQE